MFGRDLSWGSGEGLRAQRGREAFGQVINRCGGLELWRELGGRFVRIRENNKKGYEELVGRVRN